jgi:hypothetical protein
MPRKTVSAGTVPARWASHALTLLLSLLVLSGCATAEPAVVPTSEVETLIPQAVPLCLAALDAPAIPGRSAAAPILSLYNKAYEGEEWLHGPRADVHVADEQEAGRAADVQTLLCIRERREESRWQQYTDEQPAYTLIWDVRLVSWPGGEVVGALTAWGGDPPKLKTSRGPGYGRPPSIGDWVQASLRGERLIHLAGTVRSLAFSPAGARLATASCEERAARASDTCAGIDLQIWDSATALPLGELETDLSVRAAIAYLPAGDVLVLADGTGSATWLDETAGEELERGGMGQRPSLTGFTADGRWLSWLDTNGNVHVHNVEEALTSERPTRETLYLKVKDASSLALAPDGGLAALGHDDGTVTLHRVESEGTQGTVVLGGGKVLGLVFAPSGSVLAAGCADAAGSEPNPVQLYDLATGATKLTQGGHTDDIVHLAFSPDGTRLASGDVRGTVKLWDTATGTELHEFLGHTADVTALAFSPDGTILASGDWHGTVGLWDVGAAP